MTSRVSLTLDGVVQGVGFRPFVRRVALSHGLVGQVRNDGGAVTLELEGDGTHISEAIDEVLRGAPGGAVTVSQRASVAPRGDARFEIVSSATPTSSRVGVATDRAPCEACLEEVTARGSRREGYAFTSCTRCGPRWSIALALPWDRARTTMAPFALCDACAREYDDPDDRRSHAQTLACAACGPTSWAESSDGRSLARGADALRIARDAIQEGGIVALKGVGGWQLVCDATRDDAVARLRERKRREARPFAVMFRSLDEAEAYCALGDEDRALLASDVAPITLVRTRPGTALASGVAPDVALTGAMLPASTLHALLASAVGAPLVCTSGNASESPLCVDDGEARAELSRIADVFLGHDRVIARPLDDSVVRASPTGAIVMRRARGFVPRSIARREEGPVTLALGAHLKATVTLALRGEFVVSPHLGDLSTPAAIARLDATARELIAWTGARPEVIACDLHPDYASTRVAESLAMELGARLVRVQHHAAHLASVAAEHGLDGAVTGLAWDGLGLGDDGTLWGGEALALDGDRWRRVAYFKPFRLPGGDAAAREPRRSALGLLGALGLPLDPVRRWFSERDLELLSRASARGVNAPLTSSVGRLFDACAALAGLAARSRYEAEAAMRFELAALDEPHVVAPYPMAIERDAARGVSVIDPTPMVLALLDDLRAGATVSHVSARVHAGLGAVAASVTEGEERVLVGGGCFANVRLARAVRAAVEARGGRVLAAKDLPPGDGGLSVGQCVLGARRGVDVPRGSG